MADKFEKILCDAVPEPASNIFSNCLRAGNQLFLSGMTAGDGKGGVLGDGSPYDQSRQCLEKIRKLVEEAGGTLDDVIKLTVYLTDMKHRPDFGKARSEIFKGTMPCSTLIGISALAQPGLVVEVDAIAILDG